MQTKQIQQLIARIKAHKSQHMISSKGKVISKIDIMRCLSKKIIAAHIAENQMVDAYAYINNH